MKQLLLACTLLAFTSFAAFGQAAQFTGTVSDEATSAPLPGVTVVITGTQTGTQTDANGHFELPANGQKPGSLTFSFIGYRTQTVAAKPGKPVFVNMAMQTNNLHEVVAIGYGTTTKGALTGAVSTVTARQLKDIPINSAEEALAGRLAGVQVTGSEGMPGAEVNIRVRGGISITQDNSPLYVVDGMIEDNALSTLSPQDIASITVLKDASATAIYGARGANGVIIITTKKGLPGKTTVTYNGFVGFQKVRSYLPVLNPYQFVFYQYEKTRGNSTQEQTFQNTFGTFQDIGLYKDAPFVNWQKQVFGRNAFMQTHNVAISGGSKQTTFNLSLTDNETQAVMLGSGLNRKLVNFRLNHKVSDKFRTGFNVRFDNQTVDGQGTSNPGSSSLNFLRQVIKYFPYLPAGQQVSYYDPNLIDETNGNGLYIVNPLLLIQSEYRKEYKTRIGLGGYADYSFTKFLSFRTTVGYDYYSTNTNDYDDSLTYNAKYRGNGLPVASIDDNLRTTFDNSNVLTFSNASLPGSFSQDNHIEVMVGQESYQVKSKGLSLTQKYFPLGTTAKEALGNLNLASAPSGYAQSSPTTDRDEQRIASFFGRASYNYKDKYLASASLRADGSSVFASDRQWGYFPAASVAWRISQENFMQSLSPVISDMKLRLSYGEAGNNRIQSFLYLTQFNTDAYYGLNNTLITAFAPVALTNSLLKWEAVVSRDIGLDVSLFGSRLQVTADYYRDKSKDLLVNVPVPTTSGYTSQIQNVGATANNGFELQVNANIIQSNNFTWNASFNISFNKNKVLTLGKQEKSFLISSGWAGSANPDDYIVKAGAPVGSMYGLVNDGFYKVSDFDYDATTQTYTLKKGVVDDQDVTGLAAQPGFIKFKDLNGDGVIDQNNDRTIIGNANPKFFGGLNQEFGYKNFDMSIFLNFVYGDDVFNDNKLAYYSGYITNGNLLSIATQRWRTINDQGQVVKDPKQLEAMNQNAKLWVPMTTGSSWEPMSWAVEDGSFLRVNNITLGYTIPQKLSLKAGIQKFRAYVTVNNLAVLTGYSGFDPEVNVRRSTPMTPNVDFSAYPRATGYLFGVNVTF
jgi:TonB-linked SusC/RagA family outer membrane protein